MVVEVALESLLRQWDSSAGWLREEAADLKATDVLEQAARGWDDNARQDDWLLAGARLDDAETVAAKPGFRDRLNSTREYLLASRQLKDRRADADLLPAQAFAAAEERAKVQAQAAGHAAAQRESEPTATGASNGSADSRPSERHGDSCGYQSCWQ